MLGFFFSSRRRHTRCGRDWSSDVCSSDLDIDDILPGLIEGKDCVYTNLGISPEFDNSLMSWINDIKAQVRNGAIPPRELSALAYSLHELRIVIPHSEITVMQPASATSASAHTR